MSTNEYTPYHCDLEEEKFNKLKTTSDKILYCLKTGVFQINKLGQTLSDNKIECVDFQELEFTSLDKEFFGFNGKYILNDYIILFNEYFGDNAFAFFRTQIDWYVKYDKITLELNLFKTTKKKRQYLTSIISDNELFELKEVNVVHFTNDLGKNKIGPHPNSIYHFVNTYLEYVQNYLFGNLEITLPFDFNSYPNMKDISSEYIRLHACMFCFDLLEDLESSIDTFSHEIPSASEVDDKENHFNTIEAVYLLEKIGFFSKMENAGYTKEKTNILASRLIRRNYKNIEKKRTLITKGDISNLQKKSFVEIDKIIEKVFTDE